jgi:alkylhydroperoxidase family enzyme
MARLPYVDPEAAPEPVREALARLPVKLNIFRMMAHAETSFRPMLSLGMSILAQQELSAKLRELIILRVGSLSRAQYEWVQHVPIALAAGASEAQIAALERGDVEGPFDELERVVLRFTTEVVKDVRASDATFAALAALVPPRQVVEVLLTIGYYMMIARLLESTAVDLDPPAGTRIVDAGRR